MPAPGPTRASEASGFSRCVKTPLGMSPRSSATGTANRPRQTKKQRARKKQRAGGLRVTLTADSDAKRGEFRAPARIHRLLGAAPRPPRSTVQSTAVEGEAGKQYSHPPQRNPKPLRGSRCGQSRGSRTISQGLGPATLPVLPETGHGRVSLQLPPGGVPWVETGSTSRWVENIGVTFLLQ